MSQESNDGKTRNPLGWGYTQDRLTETQRKPLVSAMQAFLGGKVAEYTSQWPQKT